MNESRLNAVDVGDVLCVRTTGLFSWLIRLGARIRHKPATIDHVAIVHDIDPAGTPQVIEAWATVGVREISGAAYVASKWTVANVGQPKTPTQRAAIAAVAQAFLATPYDWTAIAQDVGNVFDINDPFIHEWLPGTVPDRFVCSSLASYVYAKVGLADPAGGRFCAPADWAAFIQSHGWQ